MNEEQRKLRRRFRLYNTLAILSFLGLLANISYNQWQRVSHPFNVQFTDDDCKSFADAARRAGRDAPPCRFTAYIFRTDQPGIVAAYGVSANIKGECLSFDHSIVARVVSARDDGPSLSKVPAACLADRQSIEFAMPLPWRWFFPEWF